MTRWGSHAARWARCRNAQLSAFARQVNLGLQGHRGLASCPPLSRVCAELCPSQGFVEQRAKTPGSPGNVVSGEGPDDVDGAASRQVIAELLDGIAALQSHGASTQSEIFDICLAPCMNRTCECSECAGMLRLT
eukprot:TRINITY_DN80813_c0_g1_i1.p2 TRINITY_DN80813_c0_g1~~TRINITY_DN80813_c0_g1_i1.p2  ORF type:complete len:134 (+),score=24.77 TRINITY_DN80813_c0_g1_i1:86-487(+)